MRRSSRAGLAVGGILGTGAAVSAMTLALFTGGTVVHPSPAAAQDLHRFDSCTTLRDWYVDHAVDQVGPYGWNGQMVPFGPVTMSTPRASSSAAQGGVKAVGSSASGTNTQETDVDEPDVAKTDGHVLARVVDGNRVVLSDVGGLKPHPLSTYVLPPRTNDAELLLTGDRVVVVAGQSAPLKMPKTTGGIREPGRLVMPMASGTRVLELDISDRTHPRLVADRTYSGTDVTARQYGGVVRLVTSTDKPALSFVQPGRGLGRSAATAHNKALVRGSTISDWLPSVRDNLAGGPARPLVSCAQVFHAGTFTGLNTIAVTGFDASKPDDLSSVAVTADGDLVYSSADDLYVASTRYPESHWTGPIIASPRVASPGAGSPRVAPVRATGTDIHAFALDGTGARYVASGHLSGTIRDRWSMDQYNGHLRVAMTWQSRTGLPRDNGVVVLDQQGSRLVPTGRVEGLGRGEQIKSVRWLDDMAVLVTFRQIDPLITVDLSDPTAPRSRGSLTLPGFSSYLHPIGDNRLLGLGTSATKRGVAQGAQAAVFDISAPSTPIRLSAVRFGRDTDATAEADPHAFTWLPDQRAAITAVDDWHTGRVRLEMLQVRPDGTMHTRVLARETNDDPRALPLPSGRVALVGDHVRLFALPGSPAAVDVR